jgi:FkbM family methyltransferase
MLLDYDEIIKKYNVKLTGVIHVGGHVGEEIPLYKKQTNNIHIFEPLEECFNRIDPTVNRYNVALGSKQQILPFNVADNHQSSSFLKPKTHLQEHTWVHFYEGQRMIQINTLDSYNITDCNLLNLDVQGYELEVLNGGIQTLSSIDYIFTEINEKELYENCAQLKQLDAFLSDFTRAETAMTDHGWGDAFYIRKDKI